MRKSTKSGAGLVATWLLGAAVVVVVAGVGLLKWARTGSGQAALLSLGSNKMYSEVQTTVEGALAEALPRFVPGPADTTAEPGAGHKGDHDWPAPQLGLAAAGTFTLPAFTRRFSRTERGSENARVVKPFSSKSRSSIGTVMGGELT